MEEAAAGWLLDLMGLPFNDRVIQLVQEDGSVYFSGTTWRGMRLMRISVSDWATDESDVDRAVAVLLDSARRAALT